MSQRNGKINQKGLYCGKKCLKRGRESKREASHKHRLLTVENTLRVDGGKRLGKG